MFSFSEEVCTEMWIHIYEFCYWLKWINLIRCSFVSLDKSWWAIGTDSKRVSKEPGSSIRFNFNDKIFFFLCQERKILIFISFSTAIFSSLKNGVVSLFIVHVNSTRNALTLTSNGHGNLIDPIKKRTRFLASCGCVNTSVRMLYIDENKMHAEKAAR